MDELLLLVLGVGCVALALWRSAFVRSAHDVLCDLSAENVGSGEGDAAQRLKADTRKKKWKQFQFVTNGAVVSCSTGLFLFPGKSGLLLCFGISGMAVGYLLHQRKLRENAHGQVQALEFGLPLAMERLVMAVQAGHDVTAALQAVVELDATVSKEEGRSDPVMALFAGVLRHAENGLKLEEALEVVSKGTNCRAVQHAFLHLSVAYREGGELIAPLKELSDSTQLSFQETVDEMIAKLPVKATLPLLCTFAGLILCFITSPIIQLMKITGGAVTRLQ